MLKSQLIGQILVDNTELTEDKLQEALRISEETKEFIGQVLVNMGHITERENAICLGMQFGVPFVDLAEVTLEENAGALLPESMMRKHRCIPIAASDGRLTVAMADPNNILAIDQIRIHTNYDYEVEPVIATDEDIMAAINRLRSAPAQVSEALQDVLEEMPDDQVSIEEAADEEEISLDETEVVAGEAPVVKLVNMIISRAVRAQASDIHVQPEPSNVRVRYRVDGMLQDQDELAVPKWALPYLTSRIKIMASMKIDEKRAPQGGRIGLTIGGKDYDFRVSTLPGQFGEKIVMRILDKSSIQLGMDKLGFSQQVQERFETIITRPHGIIMVTGPTGSGKSTTLYAALNKINTPEKNILTVEDPVEYELEGLTQSQVNERAGMSFATILREMLRQDPDVIMVGEIRDSETARIATEAALTGHLVLSTLHTNDAPSAVTRLVEMGVEPFLVGSSVAGVLAQRLVRRVCLRCREAYHPPQEALELIGLTPADAEGVAFYRGRGCDHCVEGYRGRVGIYELMAMDNDIRDMVLRGAASYEIAEFAITQRGMVTLARDATAKVLQGMTTIQEAYRITHTD
ncbi:MAG: GspE/PulE family protein [Armatimonadota bacterium]